MSLADTFSSRPTYKKVQISRRWQMSRGSVCCSARQLDNPLERALNFGGWRICSIKVRRPPTRSAMTMELKSGHFLWAYAPLKPRFHPSATHVQICLFFDSQNTFRRETLRVNGGTCLFPTCMCGQARARIHSL